ncbi:hypothetical protein J1N35_005234, partial [Gossypium stocksii]
LKSDNLNRIHDICRMSGCLAVKSIGRSGGSAMICREWIDMVIQSYSAMHIDALVQLENK